MTPAEVQRRVLLTGAIAHALDTGEVVPLGPRARIVPDVAVVEAFANGSPFDLSGALVREMDGGRTVCLVTGEASWDT